MKCEKKRGENEKLDYHKLFQLFFTFLNLDHCAVRRAIASASVAIVNWWAWACLWWDEPWKKMQHNGSKQCNKLELEIPQHSLNSLVAAARVNRTIRKFNDIIMINYFSIESQLMIRLSLIDVELLLRCLIGLIQPTKNRWMDSIALCECFVLQHLILWNLKAIKVNQYMSIISCYWKIESVHESSTTAIIQWKSKSPSSSKTDNI